MTTVVSAQELNDSIYQGKNNVVLASLWNDADTTGYARYRSVHIPTAQFCEPQTALVGVPGSQQGRNPLPALPHLQRAIQQWGLRAGRPVTVYDEGRGLFASRAWWILRWAGVDDVRILDGGLQHWEAAGFDSVGGPGNLGTRANVTAEPGQMPVATVEDVRSRENAPLIDFREHNRFIGRREILDLKAGHIPGAVSLPVWTLMNDDNTFRSPEEIRERFASVGLTEDNAASAIVYSGSGIHSSLGLAAMGHAGLPFAAHFVGGWSLWSANPANPIALGD
ncbi:MAG: sulfurtransferase [Corynebacterium sp.]|uniref:sulfurtransferase n=1 Tax=Corynebacterium sp. TaxID=1720 RepID=UPI00270DB914|nr:sulfurtransferase [Corynebacterium sp.]